MCSKSAYRQAGALLHDWRAQSTYGQLYLAGAVGKRPYRPFAGRNQRWRNTERQRFYGGQQVLPDWLSLQESPPCRVGLGAAYFDGDGVATRDNCFVANGILQSYVLSEYSARKLGLQTTANAGGVHNLSLQGPSVNPAKLFKEMGTGLYICELTGQGANGVTGIIAALLGIGENGIVYPVDEFTIAGNLRDMLKEIVWAISIARQHKSPQFVIGAHDGRWRVTPVVTKLAKPKNTKKPTTSVMVSTTPPAIAGRCSVCAICLVVNCRLRRLLRW